MLTALSVLIGSLVMPCGSMTTSFVTHFNEVSQDDAAIISFNNLLDLGNIDINFNVDNLLLTSNLSFDLISNFYYRYFIFDSSKDDSNYSYSLSKKLTFDTVINSDYNAVITDFNYLSHLTKYDLTFFNFDISYTNDIYNGIYSFSINCDLSILYQFSYRVNNTSNEIKSFNILSNFNNIFGSSGLVVSTDDYFEYESIYNIISDFYGINSNSLVNNKPISSTYDGFSYSFNYRQLWRDSSQTAIDDNQDWYNIGLDEGYDKGYSIGYDKGLNENPDLVNPFALVFSGINNLLSIEIFPSFKLIYVVGFGLFVGLVIFILGFFK